MSDAAEIIRKALWIGPNERTDVPSFLAAALMGDADHVHLARQPDGTITVTAMRRYSMAFSDRHDAWVDEVPRDSADGAR